MPPHRLEASRDRGHRDTTSVVIATSLAAGWMEGFQRPLPVLLLPPGLVEAVGRGGWAHAAMVARGALAGLWWRLGPLVSADTLGLPWLAPLAAYRLLGLPMDALSGQVVELTDVLGADSRRLADHPTGRWDEIAADCGYVPGPPLGPDRGTHARVR
jgi:hypothetical protein